MAFGFACETRRAAWRRRVVAWALVVVVGGGSAGGAWALFPLALAPGVALTFESGAMATGYATAIGAVGLGVLWASFATSDAPTQPALQVRVTPTAPMPVPSGWTESGSAGGDPVPPSSAPGETATQWQWNTSPPSYAGSPQEACEAILATGTVFAATATCPGGAPATLSGSSVSNVSVNGNTATCSFSATYTCNPPYQGSFTTGAGGGASKVVSLVCPDGYTASGGSCVLATAPEQVPYPEDGKCVVKASDGVFRNDPRDPDCGGVSGITGNQGGTALLVERGTEKTEIRRNADNSLTITTIKGNGDGTSTVSSLNVGPDNKLTGGSQSTVAGEGSSTGTDPVNKGGTCGGPGQPACAIDDSGFANKDGFVADKLSQADAHLAASEGQLRAVETADPGVDIDWLPSLLPGAPVDCAAIPLNVGISHGPLAGLFHADSLDLCGKAEIVRQVAGWIFGVLTVVYVFRVFFRGNGGVVV